MVKDSKDNLLSASSNTAASSVELDELDAEVMGMWSSDDEFDKLFDVNFFILWLHSY